MGGYQHKVYYKADSDLAGMQSHDGADGETAALVASHAVSLVFVETALLLQTLDLDHHHHQVLYHRGRH